jgi:hypothetical protein
MFSIALDWNSTDYAHRFVGGFLKRHGTGRDITVSIVFRKDGEDAEGFLVILSADQRDGEGEGPSTSMEMKPDGEWKEWTRKEIIERSENSSKN